MRGISGVWLALLGLGVGSGAVAATQAVTPAAAPADDLLAFLEFLGDEETASDAWNGFFDSLPPRPEDTAPLPAGPNAAGPGAAQETRP